MSSVAFGALQTRREKSDSETSKSAQPPGLNSYIDILAALVPAEVLAIHALVITAVTTSNGQGQTQITDYATLRWGFWLLMGLSTALFVLGRRPVRVSASGASNPKEWFSQWQRWEWQDWIRVLIPPAAFVGWVMLEPTSVWNAVAPHMTRGLRILIPMVGAVLLAAVTKALVTHADKKSSAKEKAAQRAGAEKARPSEELTPAQEAKRGAVKKAEPTGQITAEPQAGSGQTAEPLEEQQPASHIIPAGSPHPDGAAAKDAQAATQWVH
jgi:hypothetical protein